MKLYVLVGGLVLWVAMAAGNVKNIQTAQDDCDCLEVPGICARHFNLETWYGQFPNARGLSLQESLTEFSHFDPLLTLDDYCSHVLFNLLCFHYFPKCSPERPLLAATPCRETCTEAVRACQRHLGDSYRFPEHLGCTNFRSGETECQGESGDAETCNSQCTACPVARKNSW